MNELIILCAKYLFVVNVLALGGYWLVSTSTAKRRLAIKLVASGVVAIVLAKIAGHFFYDARPFVSDHVTALIPHTPDNGFPSDHTLLASLLAFVVLLFSRRLGATMIVVALGVGAARVAAGIHHGADILGAFVVSAVAVGLVYGISLFLAQRQAATGTPDKP